MAAMLSQLQGITVKSSTFFDFISLQTPVMFIILLYAGTGMICNDFRNNLMEIYFSKPLRWHDYLLGKAATLILLGLSVTALPALFLIAEHVILLPSWELAREAVDITALNAEIARIVARQDELRAFIDAIVADLEGDEA